MSPLLCIFLADTVFASVCNVDAAPAANLLRKQANPEKKSYITFERAPHMHTHTTYLDIVPSHTLHAWPSACEEVCDDVMSTRGKAIYKM